MRNACLWDALLIKAGIHSIQKWMSSTTVQNKRDDFFPSRNRGGGQVSYNKVTRRCERLARNEATYKTTMSTLLSKKWKKKIVELRVDVSKFYSLCWSIELLVYCSNGLNKGSLRPETWKNNRTHMYLLLPKKKHVDEDRCRRPTSTAPAITDWLCSNRLSDLFQNRLSAKKHPVP